MRLDRSLSLANSDALALAMDLAKARGAKRVIPLAVSGAFHSPVMQPAAPGLAQAVDTTPVHDAAIPIIGNIDAISIDPGSSQYEKNWPSKLPPPYNGLAPLNIW